MRLQPACRHLMLPSPRTKGFGLRVYFCRDHHWVHLRYGPVTRSPSPGRLCQLASSISFPLPRQLKLQGSDFYPAGTVCHGTCQPSLDALVLGNSNLIDKVRVGVLPSTPFRPSLLSALRVCFCLLPEPRGASTGNPGAAPSARRSAALGEAAPAHSGGSLPLGWAVRRVEGLAIQCLPRQAIDGHWLAPEGLPFILDRENSMWQARAPRRAPGDPRFDSDHEPGESDWGCSADPWGTAQTRPRCRRNERE